MKILEILGMIGIILFFIFLLIGVMMNITTQKQCESICKSKGALESETIRNGAWNLKDTCICYYNSEAFILNE